MLPTCPASNARYRRPPEEGQTGVFGRRSDISAIARQTATAQHGIAQQAIAQHGTDHPPDLAAVFFRLQKTVRGVLACKEA